MKFFFLISCTTLGPTKGQNCWKKPAWRPSGPGALKAFMDQRATLISSSETEAVRHSRSESERETYHLEGGVTVL